MKITLQDWARRNYDPPPSIRILRSWASTGQIAGAEKVGTCYMVDENAVRTPVVVQCANMSMSPRAKQILQAA
jgi:hypothetical protein